jgi:predicted RNA-binding Zn-ribbon protein involved in translation (DUF1610 family)
MLWAIASLILLLAIAFCGMAALWFREHIKARRQAAEIERFAQWSCPNCGEQFGKTSTIVQYAGAAEPVVDLEGQPFVPAVVICCSDCRFLNAFDASGRACYGRGVFFDPEEDRKEEERWRRFAPDTACPRCGHHYADWSGREWGAHNWPLGKRAPIMCCPNCGAEGMAIELAGSLQVAGVLFEDRWWKPLELPED